MPSKYLDYELPFDEKAEPSIFVLEFSEPNTYKFSIKDINSDKWKATMHDEMDSLIKNQTWDLVSLLPN